MLKLRKIFSLGLLLAALGLLVSSCVEPKDTYSVKIDGGGAGAATDKSEYEEGETVEINAGTAPAGKVFEQWTSSSAEVEFKDAKSVKTTFTMPAKNVTVTAHWKNTVVTNEPHLAWIFYNGEDQEDYDAEEYYAGDTVRITAVGSFFMWIAANTDMDDLIVKFGDIKKRSTYFIMPDEEVYIMAIPEILPFDADVRYTWEAAEQSKITYIAASYDDVKDWFENVYLEGDYTEEDASDVPLHDGSEVIPNNIYSSNFESAPYKGVYLPIYEGQYTAVCTVVDSTFPVKNDDGEIIGYNIADIVANYDIEVGDDGKSYFEVAFDVGAFLAGEDDLGWFPDKYETPDTKPRLEKTKVKKFVKKLKKGNVTYYVLHRVGKKK